MAIFNKPIIYHLSRGVDRKKFNALVNSMPDLTLSDHFDEHITELFKVEYPYIAPESTEFKKTYKGYLSRYYSTHDKSSCGVWVYFPWRRVVVHVPDETEFTKLRTARNRDLITSAEQEQFYNSNICIAGLSVGLSVVNNLVLCGGPRAITLADPDVLSLTNINRLSASITEIGEKKVRIAAQKIYELNPFAQLDLLEEGVTELNFESFFGEKKQASLLIEEMDNIKLKISTRIAARERKIPVVMATDNGDNAIVDIERFDLEPNRPLFHNLVDESELINVPDKPSMSEKVKLASIIVGHDITPRTKTSLQMVGSRLPAWPQLGTAATLSGVAVSYVARRILTKQSMPSGRYHINIDQLLDVSYNSKKQKNERFLIEQQYAQGLELLFGVK